MRSLFVPFQVDATGRVASTASLQKIAEQQIIDVLTTNHKERVMLPAYGANLRGFLFDPVNELAMADAAAEAQQRVNETVSLARVVQLTVEHDFVQDSPYQSPRSTVFFHVWYQIPPNPTTFEIRAPLYEYLDEESPL